ncbi:hypothetical protein T484DRAFT_2228908 [Baffinella frigidus]|nr:hypothetical protein T484DRAFT_2228908 [Cryptophyta sp. CCMP2293]
MCLDHTSRNQAFGLAVRAGGRVPLPPPGFSLARSPPSLSQWKMVSRMPMSAGLIACLFAMAAPAAAFLPSQLPSSLLRVQRRHTAIAPGMVLGKGTALVYDEKHSKHSGFMHPEHPQRVTESWNLLQSSGLASQCKEIEARQATVEEMGSIHTLEYLDDLMNGSPTMDESTYLLPNPRNYSPFPGFTTNKHLVLGFGFWV